MKRSASALPFFLLAFALTLAMGPNAPRLLCRDTGIVFAEPTGGEGHCFCCPDEEQRASVSASESKKTFSNEPCCAVVQQDTTQSAPVILPSVDASIFAVLAPTPSTARLAFLTAPAPCTVFRPAAPRSPPRRRAPSRAPPYLA